MTDKRMLYLGTEAGAAGGKQPGQRLLYDADDLTTHGVCFGMTGSGKTGLCIVLMEEAIRSGIPVFLVDPKGDLANLLLTFPGLTPSEFEPWIDPEQARRAGQSVPQHAEAVAWRWKEGLAASGLGPDDIGALRAATQFALYTPGSTTAAPLNVLGGFAPPARGQADWESDPESIRSRIAGTVGALLSLIDLDADPVKDPEGIFLARLFEVRWRAAEPVALESMIRELQDPSEPMRTLGAMDTETMLPRARRMQMAMALNGLIASPSFSAWTQGEPLDIERMVTPGAGGRARANILYIAHLSDKERLFFVATFLQSLITWMRAQPGTSSLRALLYIDEIFGYFPPVGNPPPKEPLLTVLKQARAFGLGALLATQNPVDVDYKGLANAGTWFLGKMQTEQDRARLLDGLSATGVDRAGVEKALAALPSRTFLLHNVHDSGLKTFTTRWAMSYLRGPMTREEIRRLAARPSGAAQASSAIAAGPPAGTAAPAGSPVAPDRAAGRAIREKPPAGVPEWFLTGPAGSVLQPALRARARVVFEDASSGLRETREEDLWLSLPPTAEPGGLDWSQACPTDQGLTSEPPASATFEDLPDSFRSAAAYKTAAAALKSHLAAYRTLALLRNPELKAASKPGESPETFRQRCLDETRSRREQELRALKSKYEERVRRLQARAEKELRELERDQQEVQGRKVDELVNAGETLLGMFLGGRRRSFTGVTGRRRIASSAAARADKSQAEYEAAREELERMQEEAETAVSQLEERWERAARNVLEVPVRPRKSGTDVVEIGLLWRPK